MKWFRSLFRPKLKKASRRKIYLIETYKCCDKHTLKRQRIEDIFYPGGSWWTGAKDIVLPQYRYWCSCGTQLTEGPSGGAAVCAVCEKCKINYGADLPGYWGEV